MSFVFTGPTELFVDAWVQHDEHVRTYRWWLFTNRKMWLDRMGRLHSVRNR